MKAKEIAEIIHDASTLGAIKTARVKRWIIEYAKGKCREQREVCENEFYGVHKGSGSAFPLGVGRRTKLKGEAILNSPEPKFE